MSMLQRAASSVSYCSSGAVTCGGVFASAAHSIESWNWGLLSLVVGILTALVTCIVNWHFRRKQTSLYKRAIAVAELRHQAIPMPGAVED